MSEFHLRLYPRTGPWIDIFGRRFINDGGFELTIKGGDMGSIRSETRLFVGKLAMADLIAGLTNLSEEKEEAR